MGGNTLNLTPTCFLLPLLFLFLFLLRAPISALGDACANVDCVRGTCVLDNSSILGYDCLCYSGWNKAQLGFFTLPSCILPNCTLDFQCGSGAPPPPPPPPSPPPPFNLFSPCNLVWCGDGTCVVNGTEHYCQCNEGSANFLNLTGLPCIKQCSFGVDCNGLRLGQPVTPPPPNGMLAPSPPPPRSPPNGSNKISKSWSCDGFGMVLLSAIILALEM